uniref:Uncharacterized protein n=1 Tax=Desertifilum tharense IPPAS B-1220 TaxID=1781255 RepID=A0ACD5GVK8_9CYAN
MPNSPTQIHQIVATRREGGLEAIAARCYRLNAAQSPVRSTQPRRYFRRNCLPDLFNGYLYRRIF